VGSNRDQKSAPPAVRRTVEHRGPPICVRWHLNICTSSVLVDLAGATQCDELAEVIGERLSEWRTWQIVRIRPSYDKFSRASARASR
jgi:hypothetical protein